MPINNPYPNGTSSFKVQSDLDPEPFRDLFDFSGVYGCYRGSRQAVLSTLIKALHEYCCANGIAFSRDNEPAVSDIVRSCAFGIDTIRGQLERSPGGFSVDSAGRITDGPGRTDPRAAVPSGEPAPLVHDGGPASSPNGAVAADGRQPDKRKRKADTGGKNVEGESAK